MSIEAAFLGSIVREPEQKTSKAGKPYLRFTARIGDGDQAQFVSVMYFGPDAAELQMAPGERVYVEGSLRLDKWEKDGQPRSGLSVMSFHARLAEIGRNRPKRQRKPNITSVDVATPSRAAPPSRGGDFYDDSIPFAMEWR
jgi:single-strand DNA-binding protein